MVAGKRHGEPTKPRQSPKNKKNGNGAAAPEPKKTELTQETAPPTQPESESPPVGDNSQNRQVGELSDEEKRALKFELKNKLKSDKAVLTSATGVLRNTKKRIKSYGFTVSEIEKLILAETDEGRLKLLAEVSEAKEALESYSYANQVEMFPDAEMRVPLVDRAAKEGEIAFYEGLTCSGGRYQPGSEGWNAWIKRYQDLTANQVRKGIQSFQAGGETPIETAISKAEAVPPTTDALDDAVADVLGGTDSLPREEWKEGMRAGLAEGDAHIREVSAQLGGANDSPPLS